ncbi:MAG: hypothetical protein KDD58_08455 [Bdellovibrionales bacterium]|nr:hypothetical protein [Bdellovibrionales bacterium]
MKITLLAGNFLNPQNFLYALEKVDNKLFIDYQLEKLLALNYEVDVVLGYRYSEEILRDSLFIRKCHIIFDPNENENNLLTNLYAGLFALYGEGFYLPIQFKCPDLYDWQRMIKRFYQVTSDGYEILRPYIPCEGVLEAGYPLGVSRKARELIMKDRSKQNLEDFLLKEYKMPILDHYLSHPYFENRQILPHVG